MWLRQGTDRGKGQAEDAREVTAPPTEAEERFARTPQGRARAAWHAGDRLFQIALPLSETERTTSDHVPSHRLNLRPREHDHVTVLDAIEAEGWHLEHTGYVYRPTGAGTGEIVGIHTFRVFEKRHEVVAEIAERASVRRDADLPGG